MNNIKFFLLLISLVNTCSLGMVCPKTYNIADFLLSKMALTDDGTSLERVNKICDHFRKSYHHDILMEKLSKNIPDNSNPFQKVT